MLEKRECYIIRRINLTPERTKELLESRIIPNIKKYSKSRDTYRVPKLLLDYSMQVLGLKKAKEFKKFQVDTNTLKCFKNKHGVKVISFSNFKGGVGKTSVAANIA